MKNKKSLGQHWLKNRVVLEEIAELARWGAYGVAEKTGVRDEKMPLCVEIGPGLGFLTSSLLRRFERVIAVEYDADLARKLPGSFPGKDLEVANEDILQYDFGKLPEGYVVAGNIPYYITSPIIEKVLTAEVQPERVVLLMQKEVAERIVSERETVLSLTVKNRAKVWAGPVVKAEEFTPPPQVDSQVVVMEPLREGPRYGEEVLKLIQRGFVSPRKKLVHNLAGSLTKEELKWVLVEVGVSPDARPGEVHLEQWGELCDRLSRAGR